MPFVVDAVIAARNAAATLGDVIADLPSRRLRSVVVVDRDSADATAQVARDAGCQVLRIGESGYGAACRRAIDHLEALPRSPDAVVFVAADGSDPAREIGALLEPIAGDNAELVIGCRENAAIGVDGRVAIKLIGVLYRRKFTDLSSFRAVRFPALVALAVDDSASGWDVEMLVKAVKLGLRIAEVPVSAGGESGDRGSRIARTSRAVFRILRHATVR